MMPTTARRYCRGRSGQVEKLLGIVFQPRIRTARRERIKIDDEQAFGRDADVGLGQRGPPALDLAEIAGRLFESMLGRWPVVSRNARKYQIAEFSITERSRQQF